MLETRFNEWARIGKLPNKLNDLISVGLDGLMAAFAIAIEATSRGTVFSYRGLVCSKPFNWENQQCCISLRDLLGTPNWDRKRGRPQYRVGFKPVTTEAFIHQVCYDRCTERADWCWLGGYHRDFSSRVRTSTPLTPHVVLNDNCKIVSNSQ